MTHRAFCTLKILLILMVLPGFALADESRNEELLEAVEKGDLPRVERLIKEGADVNFLQKEQGMTPLVTAVLYGRVEITRELLRAGARVDMVETNNSATPLMWAAIVDPGKLMRKKGIPIPTEADKLEIVRMLLKGGAKVNSRNAWGGTALLWAADAGNVQIVKELISAKADMTLTDNDGLNPLMAAANYDTPRHMEIVGALIAAGADVKMKNSNGDTALMYAMNNFKIQNVEALLAAGADVNSRNQRGLTPLMRASQLSRTDIMIVLIKAGAELQAKDNDGKSVLKLAREAGYKPAIELLEKAGASE